MSNRELEVGATFDIHIITPTDGGHLFTVHQDRKDEGLLQLSSVGKLARLEEIEAMMGEPLDADLAR